MSSESSKLILKSDAEDQHLVYGEVYAPNRPDSQGEWMTASEITKMAHEFLRSGRTGQIDVMHDNQVVEGCSVVESYIAQKDDPMFIPGAWVVGVHVPDEALWQMIKKGELNGFSMEALVTRHEREVVLEVPPIVQGLTSKSEDHIHRFYVSYDDKGQFKGGVTDRVQDHSHPINHGTHTAVVAGHSHRFSSVDGVNIAHEEVAV